MPEESQAHQQKNEVNLALQKRMNKRKEVLKRACAYVKRNQIFVFTSFFLLKIEIKKKFYENLF